MLCLNVDLSGGSILFYLGAYCYMADVTSPADKTIRLALLDGLIHIGFYVGNALAGPIKKHLGLKYNFAFGVLFTVISAAYTIIFIKESLVKSKEKNKEDEDGLISKEGKFSRIIYL